MAKGLLCAVLLAIFAGTYAMPIARVSRHRNFGNSSALELDSEVELSAMEVTKKTTVALKLEITFYEIFFAQFSIEGSFQQTTDQGKTVTTLSVEAEIYVGVSFFVFKAGVFVGGQYSCESTLPLITGGPKPDGVMTHLGSCLYAMMGKQLPAPAVVDEMIWARKRVETYWNGDNRGGMWRTNPKLVEQIMKSGFYKMTKQYTDALYTKFQTQVDAVGGGDAFESGETFLQLKSESHAQWVDPEDHVDNHMRLKQRMGASADPFKGYEDYEKWALTQFSKIFIGDEEFGWISEKKQCKYDHIVGTSGYIMCEYLTRGCLTEGEAASATSIWSFKSTDWKNKMKLAIKKVLPEFFPSTGTKSEKFAAIAQQIVAMRAGQPLNIYIITSMLSKNEKELGELMTEMTTRPTVTKITVAGTIGFKASYDLSSVVGDKDSGSAFAQGELVLSAGKAWEKVPPAKGVWQDHSVVFSVTIAAQQLKMEWQGGNKVTTLALSFPLNDDAISTANQATLVKIFTKFQLVVDTLTGLYTAIAWTGDARAFTIAKAKELLAPVWVKAKEDFYKAVTEDSCPALLCDPTKTATSYAKNALKAVIPGTFSKSQTIGLTIAWTTAGQQTETKAEFSMASEQKLEFTNKLGNPKSVAMTWTNTQSFGAVPAATDPLLAPESPPQVEGVGGKQPDWSSFKKPNDRWMLARKEFLTAQKAEAQGIFKLAAEAMKAQAILDAEKAIEDETKDNEELTEAVTAGTD